MCLVMQEKQKQNKAKVEKYFEQAHINQEQDKTAIIVEYALEYKEKMTQEILSSTSLKSVFEIIKAAPHVRPFLS